MQKSRVKTHCTATLILFGGLLTSYANTDQAPEEATIWEKTLLSWIQPAAHFTGSIGESSGDPEELAVGHHDPTREDGSIQGIELGANLLINEYLQGYATYSLHYGADEEWEGEWEEGFLKLIAPGIGEVRGGRFLARFGELNAQHLHSWDLVDLPLAYGRYLGDDGLILDGGDATVFFNPSDRVKGALIFAYGNRPSHADHGHDDEEDHDGEDHEGDDHDEDDHEGEDHDEEEHAHEHEHGNLPEDNIFASRAMIQFAPDDFWKWTAGASAALGKAEEGSDSDVYGLDLSLTWRENGYELGGQSVRWTTELLFRDVDGMMEEEHDEEQGSEGDSSWGFYSTLIYSFSPAIDSGIRLGWVEESDNGEEGERLRVSPVATYWLDGARTKHLRVQYNYDDLDETEEHTVWLQFGASFGGQEIR